jgi:hypothetical protein
MEPTLKRISLLLRDDQYEELTRRGLNVSGLVRDLIDDWMSENKITLSVTEETRNLYDRIVANTGSTDADIERFFKTALGTMLQDKIRAMQTLQETAFGEGK